jgi:hypothetical protein
MMVAVIDAPAPPEGLKTICLLEPESLEENTECPVIVWGECTYWPFSYDDNRMALCLVAYDPAGEVCGRWEITGPRYIFSASVEAANSSIVLVGQSSVSATLPWSEIAVEPPPPKQPFWILSTPTDASGHYKPDGGSCLYNLAQKLQELGIPTDSIQWYWREP